MQINVTTLDQVGSSLSFERDIPISHFPEVIPMGQDLSSVTVDGKVVKTDSGYYVSGSATMGLKIICSRCLVQFHHQLESDFDSEYVPKSTHSKTEQSDDPIEDETPTYQGDQLDIQDLIQESLLLAIPMKIVCDENCKGICPDCGQALNEKTCQCNTHKPDPRLAPLADLLKREK